MGKLLNYEQSLRILDMLAIFAVTFGWKSGVPFLFSQALIMGELLKYGWTFDIFTTHNWRPGQRTKQLAEGKMS